MSSDPDNLQFDRAEFTDSGSPVHSCTGCKQAIGGTYFEANGSVICDACQSALAAAMTGGSGIVRLVRATLFGTLAGILGAGIYFAIVKITGWEIGLIAIVVGLLVGGAVNAGSRGRGGWLYQLLAVFITYCAIVATYVPMVWEGFLASNGNALESAEARDLSDATSIQVARGGAIQIDGRPVSLEELAEALASLQVEDGPIAFCAEDSDDEECFAAWTAVMEELSARGLSVVLFRGENCDEPISGYGVPSWEALDTADRVALLAVICGIAFAAPFLTLPENIIGLLIIGFALHQAWRMNKRKQVTITGPYALAPPVATPTLEMDEPGEL